MRLGLRDECCWRKEGGASGSWNAGRVPAINRARPGVAVRTSVMLQSKNGTRESITHLSEFEQVLQPGIGAGARSQAPPTLNCREGEMPERRHRVASYVVHIYPHPQSFDLRDVSTFVCRPNAMSFPVALRRSPVSDEVHSRSGRRRTLLRHALRSLPCSCLSVRLCRRPESWCHTANVEGRVSRKSETWWASRLTGMPFR